LFAGVRFSSVLGGANACEHRRTSAESAQVGEHLGEHPLMHWQLLKATSSELSQTRRPIGTDGHVPMKHALAFSVGVNLDLVISQMEQAEVCKRKADHISFFWLEIGQSSAAEVEERRRKNRDKQRNLRAKKTPRAGDITGDITGYVGQDRLGEDDTF